VAAATDGPRLLIDDDINGVLFDPGNVEQLTVAVGRLLDDRGERDRLGTGAERVALEHQVGDMVHNFEALWTGVLSQTPSPPPGRARRPSNGMRRRHLM